MPKKEIIPLDVKEEVWSRSALYYDKSYCQCETCDRFVRIPESLRRIFNIEEKKDYTLLVNGIANKVHGVAEFGHVISESNGGRAIPENLIVQCKQCNLSQGCQNIVEINYERDMVDVIHETLDVCMEERPEYCVFIKKNNERCKNKTIQGKYCSVHFTNM